MALSPQEIYDLDKEIFNFLYNKHLEAKAKGEEFYFRISPRQGNSIREIELTDKYYYFFFFPERSFMEIKFWTRSHSEIFLFIYKTSYNGKYKITCQINSSQDSLAADGLGFEERFTKSREKIEKLGLFLQKENSKWEKRQLESSYWMKKSSYFAYERSYDAHSTLELAIAEFLRIDKPLIDTFLKENESRNPPLDDIPLLPNRLTKSIFESSIRISQFIFSQPQNNNAKNCLPLAFSRFFITKYNAIDELEIQPIEPTTQWIFLTGENAAGKTSILSGIYHVLTPSNNDWQEKISQELDRDVFRAAVETSKNGIYSQRLYKKFPENEYIAKYDKIIALNIFHGKEQENNPYFNNGVKFLYDRYKSTFRKNHYDSLVNILKEFLPNLSRIEINEHIEAEEYAKGVLFYEKDENGKELGQVSFDKLAMGYKNIINLITNIILELSNEKGKITEFIMPKDLYGIVIIDEFEQHLHPKMQRFLVEKLTTLFPKVQFIVSTHSPIPLLGAPKETAIFHVERTKEKGITIERVDEYVDWENLTPNLMFSSPIFGFSDLIPFAHKKGEKIRTIYSYGNDELLEELNKNAPQLEKDLQNIFEEE